MSAEMNCENIEVAALATRVKEKHQQGQRLVQISAAKIKDTIELLYSFDLDSQLTNLRVLLPTVDPHVPSVCTIYPCVLLYENEMHDLFGIQVNGMNVNFDGNLYKTAVRFPFGSVKAPCAPAPAEAPKAAAAAAKTTGSV